MMLYRWIVAAELYTPKQEITFADVVRDPKTAVGVTSPTLWVRHEQEFGSEEEAWAFCNDMRETYSCVSWSITRRER